MFELIRANKRKSMVLVFVMLVILLGLGFAVGAALLPGVGMMMQDQTAQRAPQQFAFDPTGGFIGLAIAGVLWIVQSLVAYFKGDAILLRAAGAHQIEKEDAPQLYNVVEEMTIAAQLSKMPDIYIIEDQSMNAFAAGRKEETAKVAITSGLLQRLNRDQLQGVMAHEIAHIKNRDVLFMTMMGVMVGTIILLSDLFLRSMFYSSMGRSRRYGRSSRDKGGGQLQIILIVIALVLAIVAPILAQLIYFASSRRREYLADAGAAVYTRYPEGLASALETLSGKNPPLQRANRATAPMYIINPLQGMKAFSLHATHPPTEERIRILRSIAGGVSYAKYQEAWKSVDRGAKMPGSALQGDAVPMREADPASKGDPKRDAQQRMRETGDMLRSMHHFLFLPCACGMRIKLPPEWKKKTAKCPRCHRVHTVPVAHLATAAAAGEVLTREAEQRGAGKPGGGPPPVPEPGDELMIEKKRGAWQSFQCSCGRTKNLAPSFDAPRTRCSGCGRMIDVKVVD